MTFNCDFKFCAPYFLIKMKKTLFFILLAILFLSGCSTYSIKKGETPYSNGFVVARYDRVIPEYTIGKNNSVPDEKLAWERFKRRRVEVEKYYKKMGYIENRFKQNFVDPPVFIARAVLGIFWLPSIAINDYKYNHDPKYKDYVDKKEDAEYKIEKARTKALKEQLSGYIQEDLGKEQPAVSTGQKPEPAPEVKKKVEPPPEVKEPVKEEVSVEKPKLESQEVVASEKVTAVPAPQAVPEASVQKPIERISKPEQAIEKERPSKSPVAVIIAKPSKGYSPLFVQFNGSKSHSPNGRIVSYIWDFGDGDTSTKKTPANSYWSTTYGKPRQYTAKLTVKDEKGLTGESSVIIEVLTP